MHKGKPSLNTYLTPVEWFFAAGNRRAYIIIIIVIHDSID